MLYTLPAPPAPGQLSTKRRAQTFRPRQASAWTVAFDKVHAPPPPVAFTQLDAGALARAMGVVR